MRNDGASGPARPAAPLADVSRWDYTGNLLHPTQKPVSVIRPFIETYSRPGALVLDPFLGAGTTAVAAKASGRAYLGIEQEARLCRAAEQAWTAGIVRMVPPSAETAVLVNVRTGYHAEFDRVVFDFRGEALPGYHLEYIDRPVRRCGSGEVVPLPGEGWLQVRFTPAKAHEHGESTLASRELAPQLPVLKALVLTCDWEATVTWVLAVSAPNRFRLFPLADPVRLVVDIRH